MRPDLLLLRTGRVDPVQRERHRFDERRLPRSVLTEDADHARGDLQVDLLEHAVVAQRELEYPHLDRLPLRVDEEARAERDHPLAFEPREILRLDVRGPLLLERTDDRSALHGERL